jgi:hypothetical protein
MNELWQECIDACISCAVVCERCANDCLYERDASAMAECVRLDRDCAAICWTAAGFLSRGSRFMDDICRQCAIICEACADECARHEYEHCMICARAARKCAVACREMIQTVLA